MRQRPQRREGVSCTDKLFQDCWAWSKINWSTWRALPLISKRFELGPNIKANAINSAWKPIQGQVPTPQQKCRAYSEIPDLLSRMLPSALAPHFWGDLAPATALQFSGLHVTKTWITAPRSAAAREGHNPHCQAEMGEEKRTKINKPTKFLHIRNRGSELCAK